MPPARDGVPRAVEPETNSAGSRFGRWDAMLEQLSRILIRPSESNIRREDEAKSASRPTTSVSSTA